MGLMNLKNILYEFRGGGSRVCDKLFFRVKSKMKSAGGVAGYGPKLELSRSLKNKTVESQINNCIHLRKLSNHPDVVL